MVTDLVKKEENKKEKKKMPKEISQEIVKKMFGNLLRAVGIMLYFIILNLAHTTMQLERLIGDIEVFAGAFLVIGILLLEKAYKKDNGSTAITGIEFLLLSLHSLSIMHVITIFKYDFRLYLLTSSYVIAIYYVLKAIILYTKGRKDYLNSLSDISEIVKKEEPIKKEAKKRKEETPKQGSIEELKEEAKEEAKAEQKITMEHKGNKKKNKRNKKKRGKRK